MNKNFQRINKSDKEMVAITNYEDIVFLIFLKRDHKIQTKYNIAINAFGYEDKQAFANLFIRRKF